VRGARLELAGRGAGGPRDRSAGHRLRQREKDGKAQPLRVSEWQKIGSPSLEGVEWIGTVPHLGISGPATIVNAPRDSKTDILAAHESEITQSGKFVITSDERGGGTLPPGASCAPGVDIPVGNGGLHFFPVSGFTKNTPLTPEESDKLWARTPAGEKAIYRAQIRTQPQGSICTSHVFQQIPGQNRIFMGYYSQGTQVFDFTENADGTVTLKEAGWFIPENANTWVSHVFKTQRNADGTFTYWGAASDGILPGAGRSAIDVYKVTLPPPPTPAGPRQAGTPEFALSQEQCTPTSAFSDTAAGPALGGRGVRFAYQRRGGKPVTIDLFRSARGTTLGLKRVKRFENVRSGFTWNGRGRGVTDGLYNARFTTQAPNGGKDVRRVALQRRNGTWTVRPAFYRRNPCSLVETFKLSKPAFGGRKGAPLGISFRLNREADVAVEVRAGGKVVGRFASRGYPKGRTIRLRQAARGVPRGDVEVVLTAKRTGQTVTQTLISRRL
jgi:hypothetical protein